MNIILSEFLQFIGIYNDGLTQWAYLFALIFSSIYFVFKHLHKSALLKWDSKKLTVRIGQRLILILRKLSYFMIWFCLVLMVIFYILNHESSLRTGGKKFDREVWLAEQYKTYHRGPYDSKDYDGIHDEGGHMYNDLDKNYLKFLMKKEDIENLLGHSREKRKYRGWYRFHDCFQYKFGYLGIWFGGPSSLLLFCNIPGTDYYYHNIIDHDFGHNI